MSALKSAHDLPKGGQMLASLPGSAALGRAKMIMFVVGVACSLLFAILALVLPGATETVGDAALSGDHANATAIATDAHAPAAETGGAEETDVAANEHYIKRAESAPTNWSGAMAYSWLFAVVFFLTLCVGALFWALLHNASNSGWGILVRRLMENVASVMPLMFVLALPLIVLPGARDALWEWLPIQAGIAQEAKAAVTDSIVKEVMVESAKGVEVAKADLAMVEKEVAAQLPEASPNLAFYLERKVDVSRDMVAKAEQDAKNFTTESVVRAQLVDEHIKNADYLLYGKKAYLNYGFWLFRFVFYAVALCGIVRLMRNWSIRQDLTGEAKFTLLSRRWSCGLLPLYAVAWTFLVFDWLMALDYTWFSTMWGVYLFAGSAVSSMALLIILMTVLHKHGAFAGLLNKEHYWIMGKLLHSFVIFWAYIAFSQFFLIWYANITEETKFYLTRNTEFWNGLTISFLVIGHFVLPFAVLLLRAAKTNVKWATGVSLWIILMQIFDVYWIIIPERGPSLTGGASMSINGAFLFDILAWIAVGGLAGAFFLHRLGQASLYPARDPRMDESLNLVN